MKTKETQWDILKRPMPLREIFEVAGIDVENIPQIDTLSDSLFFSNILKRMAYQKLIDSGDIDGSKPFHISTGSYLADEYRRGDIVWQDGKSYRLSEDKQFQFMYDL